MDPNLEYHLPRQSAEYTHKTSHRLEMSFLVRKQSKLTFIVEYLPASLKESLLVTLKLRQKYRVELISY